MSSGTTAAASLRSPRAKRARPQRSARPSCSEDHARPTLRSSTKTVFPAKILLVITLFRNI
uniref:Uncharacterized protein n=1 Tax=Meloidogyne incognita TaxID=6306 RepID=A0A914MPM2_MELIC